MSLAVEKNGGGQGATGVILPDLSRPVEERRRADSKRANAKQ